MLGGASTIGFNSNVTLGGPLVSRPSLAMTYFVTTNAAVYIGVADDTVFDKGSWSPQSGATEGPGDLWNEVEYPGGALPRDLDASDGGVAQDVQLVKATLTLQPGATGPDQLAPFTGEPSTVNLPGRAFGATATAGSNALVTVDQVILESHVPTFDGAEVVRFAQIVVGS